MNLLKIKSTFFSVLIIFLIITSLTSCEKYRMNRDQQVARDVALAETTMLDMYYVADQFVRMEFDENIPPSTTTCPVRNITAIDGSYPKTLIINYGTEACTDNFNIKRSGILEVVVTGPYDEAPTTSTVNAVNYSVNGYEVSGTIIIAQRIIQTDGSHKLQVNVPELKIHKGNGDFITWSGTYALRWVEGFETMEFPFDDIYTIEGNSTGFSSEDYEFVTNTDESLKFMFGCRWIVSGVTQITPDDFKSRTVDYGNGKCDNTAKLKIGNRSYDLTLR